MMRLTILFRYIGVLAMAGLIVSCGSSDLSLTNEVKRFEPEWMNLSEKVTFVDRYLRVTGRRYQEDLDDVNPLISDAGRNSLYELRSQYRNVISERDQVEEDFNVVKQEFLDTVEEFNLWQNRLMKGKLDEDRAKEQLSEYKRLHAKQKQEISELQDDLIRNIESHNSLMRRMTTSLKLYTNYDIRYE